MRRRSEVDKQEIGDIENTIEVLARRFESTPVPPTPYNALSNVSQNAQLAAEALDVGQALAGGGAAPGQTQPVGPASGIALPGLCPDGMFYDPAHGVCISAPFAYPPSGYEQICPNGYAYDSVHQVCTPFMTVNPPAFFPR